jgi:hypothetical protein
MCSGQKSAEGHGRLPAGPAGTVLVFVLLVVSLLLVLGMTLLNVSSSDYQVGINGSRSIQSLFNSDAGTEEAKMRLSPTAPDSVRIPVGTGTTWRAYILSGYQTTDLALLDPTFLTTNANFYYASVQNTNPIQWGWARIQYKVNSTGAPVYVDASSGAMNGQSTPFPSQVDSDGNTIQNPPILIVTAEGIQPPIPTPVTMQRMRGSVRRMITMELRPITGTSRPFSNAVHARNTVSINGNAFTDSYDSRVSAYDASTNRGANGDVSSDAIAAQTVSLIGTNSMVNGNVLVGPGGDPTTGISAGTGQITGSRGAETASWNPLLAPIPSGVTNLGAVSLSGNNVLTLSEGTYWYSSLSITGNAQLVTTGKVTIYVTGDINIAGNGFAAAANRPPNLLVYGTRDPTNSANTCTSVSIGGNGNIYAAIHAPLAAVTVQGNGEIFGAVTGNTVRLVGGGERGGFHYDIALGQAGTSTFVTGYTRYSWSEIPF